MFHVEQWLPGPCLPAERGRLGEAGAWCGGKGLGQQRDVGIDPMFHVEQWSSFEGGSAGWVKAGE